MIQEGKDLAQEHWLFKVFVGKLLVGPKEKAVGRAGKAKQAELSFLFCVIYGAGERVALLEGTLHPDRRAGISPLHSALPVIG